MDSRKGETFMTNNLLVLPRNQTLVLVDGVLFAATIGVSSEEPSLGVHAFT